MPPASAADDPKAWPFPPAPFAVIAGTRRRSWANPTSWISHRIFDRATGHDGTVAVTETKLDGMAAFETIDASHTTIMHDPRVHALGSLDETNAAIGHVRSALNVCTDVGLVVDARLSDVQNWLFDVGAKLTTNTKGDFSAKVLEMEGWIDGWEETLPELKNFILPAGTEAVSRIHLARAVSRRAERWLVDSASADWSLPLINRLSDMLFVLARYINYVNGVEEVIWKSGG